MGNWLDKHAAAIQAVTAVVTVGVTGVLAYITARYVKLTGELVKAAATERSDKLESQRQEQARGVGGYLQFVGVTANGRLLELVIANSSPLPVRGVQGIVFRSNAERREQVLKFEMIPVVKPGVHTLQMSVALDLQDLMLQLEFDDDAGVRWRKYGPGPALLEVGSPGATAVEYEIPRLYLTITALPAVDISGQEDWRLMLLIRNDGPDGEFEATVLRGVEGHPDSDYGYFNLQWENSTESFCSIPRSGEHRLEIAEWQWRIRQFAFLGPSSSYAPERPTRWASFEPIGVVSFRLQIRDRLSTARSLVLCHVQIEPYPVIKLNADSP